MPRTNLCKREEPHARAGALIAGAAVQQNRSIESLAPDMGCKSGSTARNRIRHPGKLTLSEYTALCRALHIPIEDARAAIRY